MTMLPWDDWIYKLPKEEGEIRALFEKGQETQIAIEKGWPEANELLENVQYVVASNAAMMIMLSQLSMKPLDFKDFRSEIKLLPAPKQSLPTKIIQATLSLADASAVLSITAYIFKKGCLPFIKKSVFASIIPCSPERAVYLSVC